MEILNLANKKESGIDYKIYHYPDGQSNIVLISKINTQSVKIKSRLNNFKDLELIICTVASLKELDIKNIELYVPYFLGSRSDRKFEEGSNNYLKTVICPIINSLNFSKVTVLDPHSDVLEACLNNFNKLSNNELACWAIHDFRVEQNYILISPDAGANKKIYKLAEEIGYKGEIITCSKDRDIDGKLTKTEVPFFDLSKDMVIIDDICDGGKSFINIAQVIQERYDRFVGDPGKLYLIVTHGIFSAGYTELNKYFDGIFCTNSYQDIGDISGNDGQKTNVKQLKVI